MGKVIRQVYKQSFIEQIEILLPEQYSLNVYYKNPHKKKRK